MTDRKVSIALNKIKACKEQGFMIEAVIRSYHLNVNLIRYVLSVSAPEQDLKNKKIKSLVKSFLEEITIHPELKSIINKSSIKSLKPWLEKMDAFFKDLKQSHPVSTAALQLECEKIFGILKISANKLLIRNAA